MRSQERLRPGAIFFPALPEPRPHGPLNPELLVIEESFEDIERLVQFSREYEIVDRVGCDPASPKVLGFRPPEEVREPFGSRPHDRGDRSDAEPVAETPSARVVDPSIEEAPGGVAQDFRIGVDEADRQRLLLEGRSIP